MHRLEHRWKQPFGVEIRRGRHAKAADGCGGQVGKDVAEEIGRDDDVELVGAVHHFGGERIDEYLAQRDIRVVGRDLGDDLIPEGHRVDDPVGLGG